MQGADVQTQLKNFARVYADVFNAGNPIDTPPPGAALSTCCASKRSKRGAQETDPFPR